MYAVTLGRVDMVQLLLKNKPDLTSKNNSGQTALSMAKTLALSALNFDKNARQSIIQLLQKAGAKE